MEEEPFESLARGLNRKDLRDLLTGEVLALCQSPRPRMPGLVVGMPNAAIHPSLIRKPSLGQQPFESLSDRSAHGLAIFPLANHVVINRFGAFIPQSIFGAEIDLGFKEERDQTGAVEITVHSKMLAIPAAKRPEFGSRAGLIEVSDDFNEPISADDPIFNIGRDPVSCGISDASENLDKYLYGGE